MIERGWNMPGAHLLLLGQQSAHLQWTAQMRQVLLLLLVVEQQEAPMGSQAAASSRVMCSKLADATLMASVSPAPLRTGQSTLV
jgi:hypothetical protein